MESDLFVECMGSLGADASVVAKKESAKITQFFKKTIPFGFSSIDWKKIPNKINIQILDSIIPTLEHLLHESVNKKIYIFWNDASLPLIKTDLNVAINHFDYITCLGFETWFYNPYQGYIMEFSHSREISLGFVPTIDAKTLVK